MGEKTYQLLMKINSMMWLHGKTDSEEGKHKERKTGNIKGNFVHFSPCCKEKV